MRETNTNEILKAKAARLRKETGNAALWPARTKRIKLSQLMKRTLVRPIRILLFSPIVLLIALYMAITFSMTFLLFATFPAVFQHTYLPLEHRYIRTSVSRPRIWMCHWPRNICQIQRQVVEKR